MKKALLLFTLLTFFFITYSQVKIGDNPLALHPRSLLELESTNRGLLLPRMTNIQMITLQSALAPDGMLVYNTDNKALYIMRNSQFVRLADTTKTISFPYTAIVNTAGDGFNLANNGTGRAIVGNGFSGAGITGTSVSGAGGFFSSSSGIALATLSGNVGIGTQTPAYILDVNGRMRLRHNSATSGIWFNRADNVEAAFVGQFNDTIQGLYGPGASGSWKFFYDYKNTRMGIGVSDPSASLYVKRGNGVSGTAAFEGTSNISHFNYSIEENTFIRGGKSNSKVIINDGSTGNVGIFTASPKYPLTVFADGEGIVQSNGAVEVGTYAAPAYGFIQTYSNHPLAFSTYNGTARLLLATNGYFGIGTTTPAQKVDIGNGRLRFTGHVAANNPSGIEFTNTTGTLTRGFIGQKDDNILGIYGFAGSGWSLNHNIVSGNTGLGVDAGAAKLTIYGGAANALDISGGIKVSGSNKPAFQLMVNAANQIISSTSHDGNQITGFVIDNALSNNDPNAMLFVTPVATANNRNIKAFAVEFNSGTGYWQVNAYIPGYTSVGWTNENVVGCSNSFQNNEDCKLMSYVYSVVQHDYYLQSGAKFNIMIVKQ